MLLHQDLLRAHDSMKLIQQKNLRSKLYHPFRLDDPEIHMMSPVLLPSLLRNMTVLLLVKQLILMEVYIVLKKE